MNKVLLELVRDVMQEEGLRRRITIRNGDLCPDPSQSNLTKIQGNAISARRKSILENSARKGLIGRMIQLRRRNEMHQYHQMDMSQLMYL